MTNTKDMKRIPSRRDNEVWMLIGPMIWSRLPLPIKTALLEGIDNIALSRDELAKSAKVQSLPPVQIVGALWMKNDFSINGMAGPVRFGGGFRLGIELAAHSCLCTDRSLIRAILVHEFLHVFNMVLEIVDHEAAERGDVVNVGGGDLFSAADDNIQLANPEDWFNDRVDWELVRHGDDERMQKGLDDHAVLLSSYLPITTPTTSHWELPKGTLGLPEDLIAHARKLRGFS